MDAQAQKVAFLQTLAAKPRPAPPCATAAGGSGAPQESPGGEAPSPTYPGGPAPPAPVATALEDGAAAASDQEQLLLGVLDHAISLQVRVAGRPRKGTEPWTAARLSRPRMSPWT